MWRCKKYDTPDWEAILLQASIWKQLRTGRKAESPILLFTAVTLLTLQISQWDRQLDVTFFYGSMVERLLYSRVAFCVLWVSCGILLLILCLPTQHLGAADG